MRDVSLREEQKVNIGGTVYCKHCGNCADYHYHVVDYYDKDEWYTCNCKIVNLIAEEEDKIKNISRVVAPMEKKISKLLSEKSEKIKKLQAADIIVKELRRCNVSKQDILDILKKEEI